MMKSKWIVLLGVAFLLALPAPGTAEPCSGAVLASAEIDAFLATLQPFPPIVENQPTQADFPVEKVQNVCTIEQCEAAYEVCAQYCTFPCKPIVRCSGSICGACMGCSC